MRVSFLYYEECPSHDLALERLREVMAEESIANEVEVIKVETEEQAHESHFVGPPTIRVDGQDVDPPIDSRYALTCRVYHLRAVARLGQVGVVLSEDFNPGAVLDGVSFTNPLDTMHSTSPPWVRSS